MKFANKKFKTVIFMGAGASRGAIRHVLLNQKRIKPPLNGDFFKIAETFARAKGQNSAAQKKLDGLHRVFKRDLPSRGMPTMEEAFSMLYVAKDFPEIYARGQGPRPVAGERKEIADFLQLLFPILTLLDQGDLHTSYDDLVAALTDQDTLITLNYDTMLDSALRRRGWEPHRGYAIDGSAARKIKWPQGPQDNNDGLDVKLLKLHGSMNWFVKGTASNLKKVFSSKPVKITKPRTNEISGYMRQIVPPLYGKIFEHPHWRKLWTEAFKALCNADAVIIIGCSLVDTDFHLRALFSQVARTRKRSVDKFARVYFVDKTTVRRKWRMLLKGSFIAKFEYQTFQKFLREGVKM